MSPYATSLVIGPDGSTHSHVHSMMGCYSLASTEARALAKLRSAIPNYFSWLLSHGEDLTIPAKPRVSIVEKLRIRESPAEAGGPDPLLRCDSVVATDRDVARSLLLLEYARDDLLRLVSPLPRKALKWKPRGEPRSLLNTLQHIAKVDIWYLSRLEADPPLDKSKMKDVFSLLEYSRSLVKNVLPNLRGFQLKETFYPRKWSDRPWPWTATKVLHRLVTHERQHTNYIRRILTLPGGPLSED